MLLESRLPLVSSYVRLEDHVRDKVCVLSDGSAFAMFAVEGRAWETADGIDVSGWHDRLNLSLRNVATSGLVLGVYLCRRLAGPEHLPPLSDVPGFTQSLSEAYRARLDDVSLYVNRLFLTVQLRPEQVSVEWLDKLVRGRRSKRKQAEALAARVDRIGQICELLEAELAPYGTHRLGLATRGNAVFSEIAEAVALAVTSVPRPVPLTNARLGNTLLTEDVSFGHEVIEIRGPGHTVYAAQMGLREYPAETWPGMFDALLSAPFAFTLVHLFSFLSKADGHSVLTRKQNKMLAAGDKAGSQIDGLDDAADQLASNVFVMGEHNVTLCAFADTAGALPEVATSAWNLLGDAGVVVGRDSKALMAGWLSMLPGNLDYRVRPGAISSRNFAAFAPLHNYPHGRATGHWDAPITTFRTSGGTPYRFHWHVEDVGNALISGETGTGKSLLVGFLIAQTAGRAGIIALDFKRGWEILIRALGGAYAVLGEGRPHFAPLKALDASPRSLEFLSELIRGCIVQGGHRMTPEEERRLGLALETVMALPPELRSMGEVRAFFSPEPDGAWSVFEKWCMGGELGWVLDAPTDAIRLDGDLHGLDVTALLENPRARGPALLYLFHRIQRRLDGRPLLIPTDEGWRALIDETFRPAIQKQLRTIRSFNGALVFVTQSPSDIIQSGIAASLIEQCPTQIHLPNLRATREDYIEGLKRTDGEYEALRHLPKGSGRFLLCQGSESLVAQLPLHGLSDIIAVLSGREETVRLLDGMAPEVLADPARMLAEFHRLRTAMKETTP